MNNILKLGVVTPFVLFNFATGSIEATIKPKYFVSLEHNRTCTKACTFKLNVKYVPDTFSPGTPTVIDNMLITSVRQRVTYCYGYYDCYGGIHLQQQQYVGQVYTYSSNTNIASGTVDYTIEGTSYVAELANEYDVIRGKTDADLLIRPSTHFRTKLLLGVRNGKGGFYELGKCYKMVIDGTDYPISIPNLGRQPVLDLIMGKSNNITTNKGVNKRVGGLVDYSYAKKAHSIEAWYKAGGISQTDYDAFKYSRGETYNAIKTNLENELKIPFMCYIDDICDDPNKYGTLYYVPGNKNETNDVFVFRYGNNEKNSDVLNFSVSYDGSVPLAAAPASDVVQASADADGNVIGQSIAINTVNNLNRNTYPTKSGFDESLFLSEKELSKLMLYPFEASMTVIGQIVPSQLLDIIQVVVLLNGTEVPVLTGKYQILEIIDDISSSGFHTTFKMRRFVEDETVNLLETPVATPSGDSNAQIVERCRTLTNSTSKESSVRN